MDIAMKRNVRSALLLWLVLSATPLPAKALPSGSDSIRLDPAAIQAPVSAPPSECRLARGEMVEGYFPEPGESEESAAAKIEAVNAKNQRERLREFSTSELPNTDGQAPVVSPEQRSEEPPSPDPFRSDTPRRQLRPLFMEQPRP